VKERTIGQVPALRQAATSKRRTYRELVDSPALRLVVVAAETGRRLNPEANELLAAAAAHQAQSEAAPLRGAVRQASRARWSMLHSAALQDALAATLTNDGTCLLTGVDGPPPSAIDLWLDEPTLASGTVAAARTQAQDDADWTDSAEEEEQNFGTDPVPPVQHGAGGGGHSTPSGSISRVIPRDDPPLAPGLPAIVVPGPVAGTRHGTGDRSTPG